MRQNVLILDDDKAFGEQLAEALTTRGHVCRLFCDAEELRHADWRWAHVAVVDLQLPRGQDGSATLRRLADAAHPRLILVSGHDSMVINTAARAARDLGYEVADCLGKPIAIELVFDALELAERPRQKASEQNARTPTAAELHTGITQGEIRVVYQPKIDLRNGAPGGFEALARWHSPRFGEVPASAFVPVAEQSGLISALTGAVMRKVTATAVAWAGKGERPSLSVNLSAILLEDPGIVDRLTDEVVAASLSPSQIVFELTETAAVAMRGVALEATARLRVAGFGLSLDDFGAGENRFERLIGLPLTELKLDRRFVDAVLTPQGERIVRGIASMAHALGMVCVGEGVEHPSQAAALKRAGCDFGQGWFFGKPEPAPSFATNRRPIDVKC